MGRNGQFLRDFLPTNSEDYSVKKCFIYEFNFPPRKKNV